MLDDTSLASLFKERPSTADNLIVVSFPLPRGGISRSPYSGAKALTGARGWESQGPTPLNHCVVAQEKIP